MLQEAKLLKTKSVFFQSSIHKLFIFRSSCLFYLVVIPTMSCPKGCMCMCMYVCFTCSCHPTCNTHSLLCIAWIIHPVSPCYSVSASQQPAINLWTTLHLSAFITTFFLCGSVEFFPLCLLFGFYHLHKEFFYVLSPPCRAF